MLFVLLGFILSFIIIFYLIIQIYNLFLLKGSKKNFINYLEKKILEGNYVSKFITEEHNYFRANLFINDGNIIEFSIFKDNCRIKFHNYNYEFNFDEFKKEFISLKNKLKRG